MTKALIMGLDSDLLGLASYAIAYIGTLYIIFVYYNAT